MKPSEQIANLQKALSREKAARKEAEKILEEKAGELYDANQKLKEFNEDLEEKLLKLSEDLLEIAKFPEQNPNPVMRISESRKSLFYNLEGKNFLNELRKVKNKNVSERFYSLITEVIDTRSTIKEVFEFNEKFYQFTFAPIIEKRYVNLYGVEITPQIQAEKILAESEKKYRQFVEIANDVIYQTNLEGDFTYVNPNSVLFTGYSEQELLQMNFTQLVRKDYVPMMLSFYKRQLNNDIETTYLEYPIITKEGVLRWLGQKVTLISNGVKIVGVNAVARDITERIKSDVDRKNSEEKYRSILENMELGLLEVDMDNRITKAYPKFLDLTGYTEKELLGQDPMELLLLEDSVEEMNRQNSMRLDGIGGVYEVDIRCKDGKIKTIMISGAPFYDASGNMIGTLGIHLDVTKQKQLLKEIEQARVEAQESAKAKESFLANMSHELRTPLNAVLGISQLLIETPLNPSQLELVSKMGMSAENLLRLLNDILDLSKINASKMDLNPVEINLNQLLNEIASTQKFFADEKKLKLTASFSKGIPDVVFTDQLRLSQILINLINNAIKFTDKGEVEFLVRKVKQKKHSVIVEFRVSDTGPGIPLSDQDLIFSDFSQLKLSKQNKYSGTGLGLGICKNLVELFGSELKLESEEGKGASFFFQLELIVPVLADEKNEVIENTIDLTGYSVLLAEDNEMNQFVMEKFFQKWGMEYQICNNGKEALDYLDEQIVDIILMDMQMPEMDGLEASTSIRKKHGWKTPIIALTANANKGECSKCKEVGMNDFVYKPFKEEELKQKLWKQLSPDPKSMMCLEKLIEAADGNNLFVERMIQLFLDSLPSDIEVISSQDTDAVSSQAHKLKSSLLFVANEDLVNMCKRVEIEDHTSNRYLIPQFMNDLNILKTELTDYLSQSGNNSHL